ncbi:TetR/AcrR family transcriptional regulator [Vibrio sp. ZSDE26]|uniref:TetR/AcrR family transcriptional regulator n=1 Tax=Vibrio amylolyticus TaxID=2847292 RepID=A0A9X2BHF3_9VIBR|nr:TetR/AcrR family transcriptional regulator [Vibrio amylolyticus]MCK6263779.1 TetR/AcrR family transcriptional regulator [Vibrio amylolyticus]
MSKKRDLLLSTALELFYRHGINSIGINEVIKVSGVAKKTLYSHFSSKEDLVLRALEKRHLTFMQWLGAKLENTTNNSELIDTLFHSLKEWFESHEPELGDFNGCFFINTSAEFHDAKSEISRYCSFHKAQVRQLIQNKLSEDSDDLLNAICLLKEGAITTAYMTGASSEVIENSVKILHRLE